MSKPKSPVESWRLGQFAFNFLAWLKTEKGYGAPPESPECRMADPFHIQDDTLIELVAEYVLSLNNPPLKKDGD